MFKPNDWGVVDWRAAAMLKQLELSNRSVDEALSQPVHDEKAWDTYNEIEEWLAFDLNEMYRNRITESLRRAADVEMAVFALSFKLWK
jgi:hypothetical protein